MIIFILLAVVVSGIVGWCLWAWFRRAFLRGGGSAVSRYLNAWEQLLSVDAPLRPSLRTSQRPKGHARLDLATGRSLRHGGEGASESVEVELRDDDVARFDFWEGGLVSISFGGAHYDDTCSEFKSAQRLATDLLQALRSQCGFVGIDRDDAAPRNGAVDTSRSAVLERRAKVERRKALLSGKKVEDEDEEAKPTKRKRS
jgi:hypothetical protein